MKSNKDGRTSAPDLNLSSALAMLPFFDFAHRYNRLSITSLRMRRISRTRTALTLAVIVLTLSAASVFPQETITAPKQPGPRRPATESHDAFRRPVVDAAVTVLVDEGANYIAGCRRLMMRSVTDDICYILVNTDLYSSWILRVPPSAPSPSNQ